MDEDEDKKLEKRTNPLSHSTKQGESGLLPTGKLKIEGKFIISPHFFLDKRDYIKSFQIYVVKFMSK